MEFTEEEMLLIRQCLGTCLDMFLDILEAHCKGLERHSPECIRNASENALRISDVLDKLDVML